MCVVRDLHAFYLGLSSNHDTLFISARVFPGFCAIAPVFTGYSILWLFSLHSFFHFAYNSSNCDVDHQVEYADGIAIPNKFIYIYQYLYVPML